MWVEAEHIPIYLANDTTSLASREGTFDKAINDSALDLYKSSGTELKNLMLSEKASDRRYAECVISGYIYKHEKKNLCMWLPGVGEFPVGQRIRRRNEKGVCWLSKSTLFPPSPLVFPLPLPSLKKASINSLCSFILNYPHEAILEQLIQYKS